MKILVTGAWNCTKEQLNKITELGHSVVFMQNESDNLPVIASEIDGVICNGLFLHHDIDEFTNLKYIQLTSAGFDRVPMDKVTERGIKIFNARGVYSIPMAEFAISGVLDIYKRKKFFFENQTQGKWEKSRDLIELYGKTVCIIGCGNVGTECAKRFKAFGANVYGVDLYPRDDENYIEISPLSKIDECLQIADVVVLTLPLTEESKGLMNKARFDKMKKSSVLVNIARGKVVDEIALVSALKDKLLGAVLDVFDTEPLTKDSELWQMENVILTPHNSFVSDGNGERLKNVIISNLSNWR